MSQTVVAISSDFFTAFAALPRQIQGKVTEFINKFRNNPKSPGINYEKIHDSADKKMWSVRIDDTYRGIVVRQEESGVYLLLWVDHHDEAYTWARRKKCAINPQTGNVQVFDVAITSVTEQAVDEGPAIFSHTKDRELLELGVPVDQLEFVRSIKSINQFHAAKGCIPEDAYEALEWIANGFDVQDVLEMVSAERAERDVTAAPDDFVAALHTSGSQKSFFVVEGEEELRRMMAEPLEKWRVFLHPAQRKIVQKHYSGPARVLGGAGTGKTVVAMHRAKWLAGKLGDKEKVLFTTFTANLAGDIKENLRKICTVEEQKRIEAINLDAWVAQFLREQGYSYSVAYDDALVKAWEDAITLAGEGGELSTGFFADEWSKVVCAQEAYSLEQYLKASRIGRGTRLDRKTRMQVWRVFEEYQNVMKELQLRDIETAMYESRKILDKTAGYSRYASIVVDEGQDLSMSALRLLRAMAGPEHANDLFIVGDTHQRIYKNKAVLSKCGINVRGRSSYLKINYRTTEEIRKYAFGLLKGISFDDMDEDYDDGKKCQSLTHGNLPIVKNFKTAAEEADFLTAELKRLEQQGVNLKDVCIVARTHKLLDDYIKQLAQAGIPSYEIKRSKQDDRNFGGVRMATMHRVKGLEFRHVFVVAANKRILPLASAIVSDDPVVVSEAMTAEKCLLYVALTRAKESVHISSYGSPSEFLV